MNKHIAIKRLKAQKIESVGIIKLLNSQRSERDLQIAAEIYSEQLKIKLIDQTIRKLRKSKS